MVLANCPIHKKRIFRKLLVGITSFLCLSSILVAEETLPIQSVFIPAMQGFDFSKDKIVDSNKGDITILSYGIEASSMQASIAELNRGFIEDVNELPEEKSIRWSNFADFITDMIYTVRCSNGNYGLFELVEVKTSNDNVVGVKIDYIYQPNGSRIFK